MHIRSLFTIAFVAGSILLYFDGNVGLGNQLLSMASAVMLSKAGNKRLYVNATLQVNYYDPRVARSIYYDCYVDASHEMSPQDLDYLHCTDFSKCHNSLIKGGQYFVPQLMFNPSLKTLSSVAFIALLQETLVWRLIRQIPSPSSQSCDVGIHLRDFSNVPERLPEYLAQACMSLTNKTVYLASLFDHPRIRSLQAFKTGRQQFQDLKHDLQALYDLVTVSRCRFLLLSPQSTFSYVAAALHHHHHGHDHHNTDRGSVMYLGRHGLRKPCFGGPTEPCAHLAYRRRPMYRCFDGRFIKRPSSLRPCPDGSRGLYYQAHA
jgi:hypothetical protein